METNGPSLPETKSHTMRIRGGYKLNPPQMKGCWPRARDLSLVYLVENTDNSRVSLGSRIEFYQSNAIGI